MQLVSGTPDRREDKTVRNLPVRNKIGRYTTQNNRLIDFSGIAKKPGQINFHGVRIVHTLCPNIVKVDND